MIRSERIVRCVTRTNEFKHVMQCIVGRGLVRSLAAASGRTCEGLASFLYPSRFEQGH